VFRQAEYLPHRNITNKNIDIVPQPPLQTLWGEQWRHDGGYGHRHWILVDEFPKIYRNIQEKHNICQRFARSTGVCVSGFHLQLSRARNMPEHQLQVGGMRRSLVNAPRQGSAMPSTACQTTLTLGAAPLCLDARHRVAVRPHD
jgi:hypothetical protein